MSWLQSLRGKCAVVTGSTSGIGWGIAQQFAKVGCRVLLHGLEKEGEVAHLKEELASLSQEKVGYSSANLVKAEECKALIDTATQQLGQVDILVNNAGVQHTAPVHTFPVDKWDFLLAVNLTAPFHLTRHVIPQMYSRKWGRLIHIASAHGKVASRNKTAYCATKHGIIGFSRSVALEACGTGVTSNCICPGWVHTPLVAAQIERMARDKGIQLEQAKMELLLEKQPSGEFVQPEQLGALAVWLATDAAAQAQGGVYSLDGGWTVH